MSISVYKTFSAGEVLTAADLNSSFSQIVDNGEDVGFPATQSVDINGQEVVLDADADTSITADTDDQIDFRLAGNDLFRMLITSSQGEFRIISIDATASAGPILTLDRNSATPADEDDIGKIIFRGRDDGGASSDYAVIYAEIADTTDATEDARIGFELLSAGSAKTVAKIGSGSSFTMRSDDAGAAVNPQIITHRDSASPAADDQLGKIRFDGEDDGGTQTEYASIVGFIVDPTDLVEDGGLLINTTSTGSPGAVASITGNGLLVMSGVATTDVPNSIFHASSTVQSGPAGTFRADHASFDNNIAVFQSARTANAAFHFVRFGSDYDGTPDTEFRFDGAGNGFADGSFTGSGAGYAEMFEWADGNPTSDERIGITVALDGDKIRPAQPGDQVVGVITGRPTIVGNARALKWVGRYEYDKFNRYRLDEDGNRIQRGEFDPERDYKPRQERQEWGCVSLLGQEIVRDGQPTDPRWIKMQQRADGVSLWLVR